MPVRATQLVTPPIVGESGMPTQSWFKESSNDLARDLADVVKQGKLLAVVWEQRGCYYCKQMHEHNFQVHEVVSYVRSRFEFVQINMRGNRVVMDLEGNPATEAMLARRNRVTGTPTIQFLDRGGKEVFRMPGYAKPALFLTVFEYVAEKAYISQSLKEFVGAKIAEARNGFKQTK
jgi:thioredoxin-related protein